MLPPVNGHVAGPAPGSSAHHAQASPEQSCLLLARGPHVGPFNTEPVGAQDAAWGGGERGHPSWPPGAQRLHALWLLPVTQTAGHRAMGLWTAAPRSLLGARRSRDSLGHLGRVQQGAGEGGQRNPIPWPQ